MASYVASIVVEGTIIHFYDKCGDPIADIDLCPIIEGCGFATDPGEDPGKWPDPPDDPLTRCRVAVHLGQFVAERLVNFFNGLNLNSSILNWFEPYVTAKIAEWGWPITAYTDLRAFAYSLFDAGGPGTGLDALNDWTTSNADDLLNARQTLYCSIDDSGAINGQNREIWAQTLELVGGDFETVLAQFIRVYPLENLRADTFTASTTEGSVDCSSFDCEGAIGDCGTPIDAQFVGQLVADYGFSPITTGDTDQFPGLEVPPTARIINTERTSYGWQTTYNCQSGECDAAAIIQEFATPFTLCSVDATVAKLNPSGGNDKGNTRIGGVYVKYAGQTEWTMLARDARGIGVNPVVLSLVWEGVAQIDAIAVIAISGGSYAQIKSCRINV